MSQSMLNRMSDLRAALITPEIVDQVVQFGHGVETEVCGVLTPDSRVVQLPNVSPSPRNSYVIDTEDLVNAIYEYADRAVVPVSDLQREHFIIWHTHPGGVVGPSKGDLRRKAEGFRYLVVTLPEGTATLF